MAMARAVNRVTKSVESRTVRAIARQASIPTRIVRSEVQTIQVKPGSASALVGEVRATGRPIPLREFKAKQFSYGVKAKVWGKMRRFEGMFIYAGTYRSRTVVGSGHVFQRVTSRSLPIARQDGPAVPSELVRGESKAAFETTVGQMLPERLRHELARLLPLD